jgi:hypothetical protein
MSGAGQSAPGSAVFSIWDDKVIISNCTDINTTLIAVLPFDSTSPWIAGNGKPTTLTGRELLETERLLRQAIARYNPGQEK